MNIKTAKIIIEIENILNRTLSAKEEVNLVDAIEFSSITDAKELIRMFDLDLGY